MPFISPEPDPTDAAPIDIDDATIEKIEALIKDADQYWLAIVASLFCSALGFVIIGPWYWLRLRQWHSLAKAHPFLLTINPHYGSVADRFQTAKKYLLRGMRFGAAFCVISGVAVAWEYFRR